jgi:uncharacterized protein (TIGR02265 family)
MNERLVFEQTIEGLYKRALGGNLPGSLKEQLRREGLDLDRKLLPAYPVETWEKCLTLTARAFYPGKPDAEAMKLLGERHIAGFHETMLGRALFGVLKLLGPRRRLSRTRQNFRAGNNYQEVRITEVSPTEVDMWLNELGPLRYFKLGIITGSARASGDLDAKAVVAHFDDQGVTYRISWGKPLH